MKTTLALTALVAILGAGSAHATSLGRPCTTKPASEYLALDALKAKVVEQGYEIRRGEIEKACGEFYVIDKAGERGEIFVDPTSGATVAKAGTGVRNARADEDD